MSNMQGTSGMPAVQEFSIRVPKNGRKKYNMMRFNSVLNVDFPKWTQVKMERENNLREFKGPDEEQPKFGAGSEFGREAKEEARRKKYGIITKKYRPEDQPWILKVGGKTGKKFKGIREGGIGENAAYYVFTHAADGAIEAYPLTEWYNFQPIARYKALSAEEAEQEFGRRNKAMNYFSLMLRKRLRNCDEGEIEEEESKVKRSMTKAAKDLKISDMDDWVDSEDEDSNEEESAEESKEKKPKKQKGKSVQGLKKKKKKHGSDDSAVEESDDGDEEGRELDYISDSSDNVSDLEAKVDEEMKGVAEESALRKLLVSDEEEEEEEEDENKSENEENPEKQEESSNTPAAANKKKKKKVKKEELPVIKTEGESSTDSSADSSDSESETKSKHLLQQQQQLLSNNGATGSPLPGADLKRVSSPTSSSSEPLSKKPRIDTPNPSMSFLNIPCFPSSSQQDFFSLSKLKKVLYLKNVTSDFWDPPIARYNGNTESGITEEAVRRYLMRKPMTTTELLQKFKSRKTGLSSEQLVNIMTQILKRINPAKQTIKNKMYLFIKA